MIWVTVTPTTGGTLVVPLGCVGPLQALPVKPGAEGPRCEVTLLGSGTSGAKLVRVYEEVEAIQAQCEPKAAKKA